MIINKGEKIYVIIRRNFENDPRRHFIGEITEASENVVRVKGRTIVYDSVNIQYEVKPEPRERLISLVDSRNIINIIPRDTKLDIIKYMMNSNQRLIVTDGEAFTLDINEFGVRR